jgi:hypothetical protein
MPECGKALRTRAGFAKTTLRDLRLCFTPKIAKCVTEGVATPRADPVGESSPLRSAAAAISFQFVPSARSFSPVSQAAVQCLPHRGRLCDSQAVEVGRRVQHRAGGWGPAGRYHRRLRPDPRSRPNRYTCNDTRVGKGLFALEDEADSAYSPITAQERPARPGGLNEISRITLG